MTLGKAPLSAHEMDKDRLVLKGKKRFCPGSGVVVGGSAAEFLGSAPAEL
jgi:hypothetical protein